MRSHEARQGTIPPKPELLGQSKCFKYLTGGPADPAWCWLIVFLKLL